jgi:hypothetical protein
MPRTLLQQTPHAVDFAAASRRLGLDQHALDQHHTVFNSITVFCAATTPLPACRASNVTSSPTSAAASEIQTACPKQEKNVSETAQHSSAWPSNGKRSQAGGSNASL